MKNILILGINYLLSVVKNIILTFNTTKYSQKIFNIVVGQSSNWYLFHVRYKKEVVNSKYHVKYVFKLSSMKMIHNTSLI